MAARDPSVSFREELPVPVTNLAIYEHIYVLEQWLRRIAYASLMAKHGPDWKAALPDQLAHDLKGRLNQLRGRVHLHAENSDNAIWLLTLEELRLLLTAQGVWPLVKDLTQIPKRALEYKLDELREIRNIVGHSRATTRETAEIVEAIATTLRPAIDSFKQQLLYGAHDRIHLDDRDDDGGSVSKLFAELTRNNDWSKFQPMLSSSAYFYSLTRLPVAPFDVFLRVKAFLREMGHVEHVVLAVLVNKAGDEFTLCWPKKATEAQHERLVRFFVASHADEWTETEYERQSASAVCDPRIWFYENQQLVEE
ncbi:MAG TPA: hypothetical protein VF587_16380 [Solirubrobacteraceae bacterium]|jgi:hypothetical protein